MQVVTNSVDGAAWRIILNLPQNLRSRPFNGHLSIDLVSIADFRISVSGFAHFFFSNSCNSNRAARSESLLNDIPGVVLLH
jgi:hypothetical protein